MLKTYSISNLQTPSKSLLDGLVFDGLSDSHSSPLFGSREAFLLSVFIKPPVHFQFHSVPDVFTHHVLVWSQ